MNKTRKIKKVKLSAEEQGVENAINKIKEKDPDAYTPMILPFKIEEKELVKNAKEELIDDSNKDKVVPNENQIYLFQFPRQIPLNLPGQEKEKLLETYNDEPIYDQNGYLIKPEFQNSFLEVKKNFKLGKLRVYKSGKVKLKIGDNEFDVQTGVYNTFYQQVAIINKEMLNQTFILGKTCDKKMVVIPQIK